MSVGQHCQHLQYKNTFNSNATNAFYYTIQRNVSLFNLQEQRECVKQHAWGHAYILRVHKPHNIINNAKLTEF